MHHFGLTPCSFSVCLLWCFTIKKKGSMLLFLLISMCLKCLFICLANVFTIVKWIWLLSCNHFSVFFFPQFEENKHLKMELERYVSVPVPFVFYLCSYAYFTCIILLDLHSIFFYLSIFIHKFPHSSFRGRFLFIYFSTIRFESPDLHFDIFRSMLPMRYKKKKKKFAMSVALL